MICKYHDNTIKIKCNGYELATDNSNKCGYFEIKDFCVTDGQDPSGRIYSGKIIDINSNGELVFKVGRHGSEEVANWWKRNVSPGSSTFNEDPNKLNFAFMGKLVLYVKGIMPGVITKVEYDNICIAQQHEGAKNNWCFGGFFGCYYHHMYNCDINYDTDIYNNSSSSVMCWGKFNCNNTDYSLRTIVDCAEVCENIPIYSFNFMNTEKLTHACWMSNLKKTQIKNIIMPGSHDAGMSELHHTQYFSNFNQGAIITQKNSIYEQLLCGSRYFDIRVDYDHDELVSYHRHNSMGSNGQSINDIFMQMKDFLTLYNSETIFVKLSHIRDYNDHNPEDTKKRLIDYINNNVQNRYKSSASIPNMHELTLDKTAGKIVILCDFGKDFAYSYENGIFRYYDASDDTSSINPNTMNIYDSYSNSSDYEHMHADQIEKWHKNNRNASSKLSLLSWTLALVTNTENIFKSIEDLAAEANKHLPEALEEMKNFKDEQMPQIVSLDFIDSDLCDYIVKCNSISM